MYLKRLFFFFIFIFCCIGLAFAQSNHLEKDLPHLLFFYSDTCHACHKTIEEVMLAIEKEFFGKITVEYLNVAEENNYKLMLELKEKYNCKDTGVPTVFIGGRILVGYYRIKQNLRPLILEILRKNSGFHINRISTLDLVSRFLSFNVFTIIAAGLIDGINPCAFTVIVFFISFLALQGYRKRELEFIGLSFILAVFLTYVLIGLGIFRFLYTLRHFYLISRIVYYSIAILCLILAGLSFYDLWLFKKTGKTEGLILQLPPILKNYIHSVIGFYYRKGLPQREKDASEKSLTGLLISAFISGFLVSLFEAVCTGQVYLPTITFMLKEPFLRTRAFAYLVLYNFMFVLPLFIVLLFALLGTSSSGFANFMRRNMFAIKLSMGILFIVLGMAIIIQA